MGKQRKKRLRFRQKAGILNLFGNEDDITDESSSSGDSDNSESDLETDLDVDICSNSNDESDGLDITDTSLPQEIREWRIKQQRKIRIGWRARRRKMRTKLRLSRKTETIVQWRVRNTRRIRRRTWKLRRANETVKHWNLRISKKSNTRKVKRLRLRKIKIMSGKMSEESFSEDSESELETDLDVDICSDSADESASLDISD